MWRKARINMHMYRKIGKLYLYNRTVEVAMSLGQIGIHFFFSFAKISHWKCGEDTLKRNTNIDIRHSELRARFTLPKIVLLIFFLFIVVVHFSFRTYRLILVCMVAVYISILLFFLSISLLIRSMVIVMIVVDVAVLLNVQWYYGTHEPFDAYTQTHTYNFCWRRVLNMIHWGFLFTCIVEATSIAAAWITCRCVKQMLARTRKIHRSHGLWYSTEGEIHNFSTYK